MSSAGALEQPEFENIRIYNLSGRTPKFCRGKRHMEKEGKRRDGVCLFFVFLSVCFGVFVCSSTREGEKAQHNFARTTPPPQSHKRGFVINS